MTSPTLQPLTLSEDLAREVEAALDAMDTRMVAQQLAGRRGLLAVSPWTYRLSSYRSGGCVAHTADTMAPFDPQARTVHYDRFFDYRRYDRDGTAPLVLLYVGSGHDAGGREPFQLRAFAKTELGVGEARDVRLTLCVRDLREWDGEQGAWVLRPGQRVLAYALSGGPRVALGTVVLCA